MRKFLSKGRGVIFTLIIVVAAFLLNSFSSVDLEKTAIIISLGVDYEQASNEYTVTGQLALPTSSSGSDLPGQTPTMITGKGNSPAAAYHNIAALTGWLPNLSFCTIIVLGNNTLGQHILDMLDFCLREKQLNDSALMCVYDGTAIDFFNQRTPLDSISAFSLLKIFAKENTQSSEVAAITLKDFAANYFRQGNGNYIPYVTPIQDINKENEVEPSNKGSEMVSLAADKMVVFNQDEKVEILDKQYVKPFVLLTKKVNTGTVNLENVETPEYLAKNLEVKLESNPANISVKLSGKDKIECEIKYSVTIKVLHLETNETNVKNLVDAHVPNEVKKAVEKQLEGDIAAFVQKIQELDCDVFQLEENLYKHQPKEYRKFKEEFGQHQVLKHAKFKITTEVSARD